MPIHDCTWFGVKCNSKYLKGNLHRSLVFQVIQLYKDYLMPIGDQIQKKTNIWLVVFLGPNPITWSSKKQASIFRSRTVAKYRISYGLRHSLLSCVLNFLHLAHYGVIEVEYSISCSQSNYSFKRLSMWSLIFILFTIKCWKNNF